VQCQYVGEGSQQQERTCQQLCPVQNWLAEMPTKCFRMSMNLEFQIEVLLFAYVEMMLIFIST